MTPVDATVDSPVDATAGAVDNGGPFDALHPAGHLACGPLWMPGGLPHRS